MEKTADPDILIEEKREGYVRYRHSDGRRWKVHGKCIRLGNCIIGSVIDTSDGPVEIKDHAHIEELKKKLGKERLDSEMDVPVGPGFEGCCPLKVVIL